MQFFLLLLAVKRFNSKKNCVFRRSKSQKMTLSKDKFDTVRRNPYSIIVLLPQLIQNLQSSSDVPWEGLLQMHRHSNCTPPL